MSDPKEVTYLRRVPNEEVFSDGNGGRYRLLSAGVLRCECDACGQLFWFESNTFHDFSEGDPPHPKVMCPDATCAKPVTKMAWFRPQTILVPEDESTYFAGHEPRPGNTPKK